MGMRLVSCLIALALVGSASAELVGYWQLDEGSGTTTGDSSGNGNVGTFAGAPEWAAGYYGGALQFNGQSSYVEIPSSDSLAATEQVTVMAWSNWTDAGDSWMCILANGQQNGPWENYGLFVNRPSRFAYFTLSLNDTHTPQQAPNNTVTPGEWQHLCGTWDGATVRIYVDGEQVFEAAKSGALTSPHLPLRLGHRNGSTHFYNGLMDEVAVFNHALTQAQIQEAMLGISPAELADTPSPDDAAVDVPADVTLGWTPGRFAATHDVYLGTNFEDVNDASRDNPLGALAGQDQAETEFVPVDLEFGRTYYWRIDEVNAAPDGTIFKGEVWTFTVEPYTYPLTAVTATASTSQAGMGPENTINGSGLNVNDQHSTVLAHMWVTTGGLPAWIQYEFDKVYKLDELWVWNSNQMIEAFLGFGAKDVVIEYSADGEAWSTLEGVPQFTKATSTATYAANTTIDFGGAMARYVKLTIDTNWGGTVPQTGLSEVRFFYVPIQAFKPQPAVAATDVSVETDLAWRPGREATSHTVYIGADSNAVAGGLVSGDAVDGHGYTPASLDFATTYYWKVDETGDAGLVAGDLWSFTTQQFGAIDDFEGYNDDVDAETTVWHAWIDGVTNENSGSQVGYNESPFAERSVVHGGKQAMPLLYDNSKSPYYSEAEQAFDSPLDLTAHGADSLCVWFQGIGGDTGNSSEGLYITVKDNAGKSKTIANADAAATVATTWQQWTIPLSEFTSAGVKMTAVKSIVVGVGNRTSPTAGGTGKVYIDDLGYGRAAQ